MGNKVTTQELALIFGVADTTITRWITLGMPVDEAGGSGRGNVNVIDTEKAIGWRIAQVAHGGESPKDRLDRLRGDREELALAKEIDLVLPAAEVEALLAEAVAAANTELLFEFPEKLIHTIKEKYSVDIDIDIIRNELDPILVKMRRRFDGEETDDDFADSDSLQPDSESDDEAESEIDAP